MDDAAGHFVEEVPGGARLIEGVSTNIAAFIGSLAGDPDGIVVSSQHDFAEKWPGDSAVGSAVGEFFRNGGSIAWIAPVTRLTPKSVRRAVRAMHPDASLVAVIADSAAPAEVVAAAAAALHGRRAMLLVEGPWTDAATAIAAMSGGPATAIGAAGADVAVYWPRLRRPDASGALIEFSPLGPVAGLIARTDDTRAVFAAPAGTEAVLHGVTELAATATAAESESLNQLGVNVIRTFPGRGTVVWGARTQSSDGEWRYVPVRRTALFLERSIERGLQWAVFEPNDEPLWQSVRQSVGTFLQEQFRRGAFAGTSPRDAYFVTCDRETMTQSDIDDGRLVCMVGFAPLKPAEFVILTITVATADHRP